MGSEEEEETLEAGGLSFTESGGETGQRAGGGISHTLEAFPFNK